MSRTLYFLACALAFLGCPVAAQEPKTFASGELIFHDDFSTFNMEVWKHELTMGGGGNSEFEMYVNSRQNSYILDGKLVLRPTLTADSIELGIGEKGLDSATLDLWGQTPPDICTTNLNDGCLRQGSDKSLLNPIRSAKVRSNQAFSFRYGRVEVVAKLPKGNWIWPAIWLLPEDNQYGNWPASGEIDMVESIGNVLPEGDNTIYSTLHWGPSFPYNSWPLTHKTYTLPSKSFNDDFHTFGLYWDEKGLYTYVDHESNKVLVVDFTKESFFQRAKAAGINFPYNPWTLSGSNAAPFNQKFYLIFNVAVGGTNGFFPDTMPNKPWLNNQTNPMKAFWDGKDKWVSTWGNLSSHTEPTNALIIDSVSVWSIPSTEATLPAEPKTFLLSAVQANGNGQEQSYSKSILYVVLAMCAINMVALGAMAMYTRSKLKAKTASVEIEDSLIAKQAYVAAPTGAELSA